MARPQPLRAQSYNGTRIPKTSSTIKSTCPPVKICAYKDLCRSFFWGETGWYKEDLLDCCTSTTVFYALKLSLGRKLEQVSTSLPQKCHHVVSAMEIFWFNISPEGYKAEAGFRCSKWRILHWELENGNPISTIHLVPTLLSFLTSTENIYLPKLMADHNLLA